MPAPDRDPVRIRVLRTLYPHWGRFTGVHQFLRYLPAGKYRVDLRVVNDGDADFPIRSAIVREGVRRVLRRNGMAWYKLSDLAAEARAAFAATRGSFDLLHYLDGEHTARYLPRARRLLGRGRPRIVATFHQPPDLLATLVRRDVVAQLDAVTLVSITQRRFFDGLLPSDRVAVIPHGIDTDFFCPAGAPVDDGSFRLITVGHHLRDYAAVGAVAKRLRDDPTIRFDVVSGPTTGLEGFSNVEHHRGVSDEQLVRLYQQAHLLLLPLLETTANNALLEGIACGLPVVSTALPSVAMYVPGDEAILIDRNDPDALTEAVLRLRRDPEQRARRAQRARLRAESLAWPRIAPRFDQLYGELLA